MALMLDWEVVEKAGGDLQSFLLGHASAMIEQLQQEKAALQDQVDELHRELGVVWRPIGLAIVG